MFSRLKRRIVAAVMGVLAALLVGTLAVIFFASSNEVYARDQEMLRSYTEQQLGAMLDEGAAPDAFAQDNKSDPSSQGAQPDPAFQGVQPDPAAQASQPDIAQSDQPDAAPTAHDPEPSGGPGGKPDPKDTPAFKLSTFYSVLLSPGGTVERVTNPAQAVTTDDELKDAAAAVVAGGRQDGVQGNFVFLVTTTDAGTFVAFMDNSIMSESATALFRYTLIFGGACLVLFFFLSVYLAGRMVAPLKEAYEQQQRFVADAGHELKTPISVIAANAELLQRESGPSRWLDNIVYENERMGALVRSLLDLEGASADVRPAFSPVDLSRLVEGEVLLMEGVAFEAGHPIAAQVDPSVSVAGDETKLRQLVSILLDNAISYADAGGEVDACLRAEHGRAVLMVRNAGSLPAGDPGALFDRFYRADESRGGEGGHYGLGLSIARAIVEAHGGIISAECLAGGNGSGTVVFTVSLPLAG